MGTRWFIAGCALCYFCTSTQSQTVTPTVVEHHIVSECEDDYLLYNETVCVQFGNSNLSHLDAQKICSKYSATLVAPNTKKFNDWLTSRFIPVNGLTEYWIGVARTHGWDRPSYFLNNLKITWSTWGRQDHFNGLAYCVYFNERGIWMTDTACYSRRRFICQKPAVCKSGRFGERCEGTCHCQHTTCDAVSGICKYGCEKGWSGLQCNRGRGKSEAVYYCINSKRSGKYMLLRIAPKGIHYADVYGINEDGEDVQGCHITEFDRDRRDGLISRKVFVDGNDTCGATEEHAGSNIYKWRFHLTEMKYVLSEDDEVLTFTCDFNHAETLSVEDSGTVNGILKASSKVLEVTKEIISLNIVDSVSHEALSEVDIGTNVAIKISLEVKNGISAKLLSVFQCRAHSSDGTMIKNLTDEHGCQSRGSPMATLISSGQDVVSKSFRIFTFPGAGKVVFTCDYEYCFHEDVFRCTQRCAYFTEQHRRKREAINSSYAPKSVSTSVAVKSCQKETHDDAKVTKYSEAWVFIHPVTCIAIFVLLVVVFSLITALFMKTSTVDTPQKPVYN